MKRRAVIGTLLAGILAPLLVACGTSGAGVPVSAAPSAVAIGRTDYPQGQRPTFPRLAGQLLGGGAFNPAALTGHVVVVNVWASWCAPCRQESPDLAKVAKLFARRGVVFLGIDEQDIDSHATAFISQAGVTYKQLLDRDGTLLQALAIVPPAAIPSTLVLDGSGKVAVRFIGQTDAASLTSALKTLVAGV